MSLIQLLWWLIRYRPVSYACKPLVMLACYSERIVFGLTIQAFFNALPTHTQLTPSLFSVFLPWLIAIVLRLLIVYVGTHGIVHFEFAAQALLQRNLFQNILERLGARALTVSIGEAISHFRDDTQIVADMPGNLGETFALFIYSTTAFIILLRVNAVITLLVFLPLCGILALARHAQQSLEKYRAASRAATSSVTGTIGEIFTAVQAIQVASAEQHVVAHFNTINDQRRASILRDRTLSSALNALFGNVVDIGTALILVLAALSSSADQLRPGDLVLFITYLSIVAACFNGIGRLLVQWTQTRVSLGRLMALLQGASTHSLVAPHFLYLRGRLPEMTVPLQKNTSELEALEARNLSYYYPGTGHGITEVNLRLPRGTLTVITGRIGAGKTTLLQTLLGLLPKAGGEIYWNGQPVANPAAFFVPPHSAYTPQVPHLFGDTLKENILLGLSEQTVDVAGAIYTAVLEHEVASFEQGLDTVIGVRGVRLSGGQIQRAAVTRMVVRMPELLVCDDLSSALDVETEQTLWERLLTARLCTCIAVSHRRAVLQRADLIIVLKDGRLESAGPLEELLVRSEEMRHIWQGYSEK